MVRIAQFAGALAVPLALMLALPTQADGPPTTASGWRQDGQGQWRGTGENFGRGYRQGTDGHWHGTGKAFGRGWRRDSAGNWRGTGENFGRGWRRE
jgi:hypothetical protein